MQQNEPNAKPLTSQPRRILHILILAVAMVGISLADTVTSYEVAAAVFYILVILSASRMLAQRGLVCLMIVCIVLTVVSFVLTPHGDARSGLINTCISVSAIVVTTWLVIKMEAARAAAQRAQTQLERLARMQTLAGLSTSIAHEVNQPLAAIVTSSHACRRWLEQSPPNMEKAHAALERIQDDAARASNIIERVRSLAKKEPPRRTSFDVNQAVQEVLSLSLGETRRRRIALLTSLQQPLPAVMADRVQVLQVLGNLVINAMDAIAAKGDEGGDIRVTTELQDDAQGRRVLLSVHDSGVGVPGGVYEHLFEAFWTTKETGMGLGLSISHAIIEANRGQIWAEAQAGGGAVFRFTLPCS